MVKLFEIANAFRHNECIKRITLYSYTCKDCKMYIVFNEHAHADTHTHARAKIR